MDEDSPEHPARRAKRAVDVVEETASYRLDPTAADIGSGKDPVVGEDLDDDVERTMDEDAHVEPTEKQKGK